MVHLSPGQVRVRHWQNYFGATCTVLAIALAIALPLTLSVKSPSANAVVPMSGGHPVALTANGISTTNTFTARSMWVVSYTYYCKDGGSFIVQVDSTDVLVDLTGRRGADSIPVNTPGMHNLSVIAPQGCTYTVDVFD